MPSRISLPLAAALCAVLVPASLALADTKTVKDGNDSPGPLDIKSATAGHKGKSLLHTIEFYEPVDGNALFGPNANDPNADHFNSLCVAIKGTEKALKGKEYDVCASTFNPNGNKWSGDINLFKRSGGPSAPKTVGKATIKQPAPNVITLAFKPSKIGGTKKYKWQAFTAVTDKAEGGPCPPSKAGDGGGGACEDAAPGGGLGQKFATHDLTKK